MTAQQLRAACENYFSHPVTTVKVRDMDGVVRDADVDKLVTIASEHRERVMADLSLRRFIVQPLS